jgi:hypothetical protein
LAKPDIVRIVEELDLFLLSYPGFLMVEMVIMVHIYGLSMDESESGIVNIRGYTRPFLQTKPYLVHESG